MTKINWDKVKWIFEPDGALRDIYIQNVSMEDWENLIDYLNDNYSIKYGKWSEQKELKKIDKESIINSFNSTSDETERYIASIDVNGIKINCHFFLPDQIEFDIEPKEIKSSDDYEKVEKFMMSVSQELMKQLTLTWENDITLPLIKIDSINNIYSVVDEDILKSNNKFLRDKYLSFRTKILLRFFPKKFEKRLIKSATETYKSTPKEKNKW